MRHPHSTPPPRPERQPAAIVTLDAIFATLLADSTAADVGQACLRALPHIDGAAISIMAGLDARRSVYTSDDVCAAIEDAQFLHAEGPCFQAFTTDSPVLVDDMRAPRTLERWPGYTPAALEAGAVAVAALPIAIGGLPLGVLDLYSRTAGAISDADLYAAARFADAAGTALVNAGRHSAASADVPGPEDRDVVHQAVGMIMVQLGVTGHDALARLRAHAYATGRHLNATAADVVGRRLSLDN
jgi:GAF domain-containing protein/ANTAR domain-containing protein